MNEITTILNFLHPLLDTSTHRQLLIISQTLLAMTGRITMLGISRWAGEGGSYRTIQRFFTKKILWDSLHWAVAKIFLKKSTGTILIAGDATTVTKSGKETFGLGRFFSSIYSRAVPGVAFQVLSLIDVEKRKSWPMLIEQILPKPKAKKSSAKKRKNKNAAGEGQKVQKTKTIAMLN